jgi:hypothetical protein
VAITPAWGDVCAISLVYRVAAGAVGVRSVSFYHLSRFISQVMPKGFCSSAY